MKGYVPDFIEKDCYILVDEEKRQVLGYAQAGDGDGLLVVLDGDGEIETFDPARMKPLPPASDVPDWLQKGRAVEFDDKFADDDDADDDPAKKIAHRVVTDIWGRERAGLGVVFTRVRLAGMPPQGLEGLRPVSPPFNEKARTIEHNYRQAVRKDPGLFRGAPRQDCMGPG